MEMLQTAPQCGKLVVKDGWAKCPVCGRKLLKTMPGTQVRRLPVKCKHCKQEIVVNIEAPEPESIETSA